MVPMGTTKSPLSTMASRGGGGLNLGVGPRPTTVLELVEEVTVELKTSPWREGLTGPRGLVRRSPPGVAIVIESLLMVITGFLLLDWTSRIKSDYIASALSIPFPEGSQSNPSTR